MQTDFYSPIMSDHFTFSYRCWISEEKGAIWAFIGPMLLIIMVITLFKQV